MQSIFNSNRSTRIFFYCLDELFELHPDCIGFFNFGLIKINYFGSTILSEIDGNIERACCTFQIFQSYNFGFLFQKVNRDIGITLKEAALPHTLQRNPAGGKISDAAIVEFDACICNVWCIAHNSNTTRMYFFHGRLYNTKNNIYVVYHQVMNHGDIRTSWVKFSKPVSLDKQWLI